MYDIDQSWAMVELHSEYKGKAIKGQFWWNGKGDKLFKDSSWYVVTDSNDKTGIDTEIYEMSKIKSKDVKIDIPGFEG